MAIPKQKLSKQVLSDRIKDFIIKLIVEENVQPGERIVESVLARELGVSQAPVREAIRDLVLIGILRNETYHGTFVSDFTKEEIIQAYQVRASIEATGIKLAVQHATAEDIQHLKKIYTEMTEEKNQKKPGKVLELDNLLHSEIMRLSQNIVLYNLWKTLRYDIWSKFTYSKMKNVPFLAVRHKEMIEAMINRDEEAAAEAMKHHILDLKAYL